MTDVYQASPVKRHRSTKAEVEQRRQDLFDIARAMRPMTVRQVFYQATVRDLVEKSESGYTKVQTDLVQMRRGGMLPYGWLADNTRWQRRPRSFDGIQDAINDTAKFYRKNLWRDGRCLCRNLARKRCTVRRRLAEESEREMLAMFARQVGGHA